MPTYHVLYHVVGNNQMVQDRWVKISFTCLPIACLAANGYQLFRLCKYKVPLVDVSGWKRGDDIPAWCLVLPLLAPIQADHLSFSPKPSKTYHHLTSSCMVWVTSWHTHGPSSHLLQWSQQYKIAIHFFQCCIRTYVGGLWVICFKTQI